MRKSLKKNYILNVLYQILTIFIPIFTIPYLSRVLQSEAVGILSYSESIVSYFVLFAVLGSTIYAQREIGKVQDDKEAYSRVFYEIQIVRTLSTVVAMAAYLVYVFVVRSNFTVCLILTIEIFGVITDIGWFFQGLEEFGKTVVFGLCAKILNLAAIFLLVKSPSSLWIYALSKCGFSVIANMLMWLLLPKYLCRVNNLRPLRHLKVIVTFFIPAVASQVYTILDKSMIGWFTVTREENGYYEYAEKIVRVSIVVITALSSVLVPRVSKAYADGDSETVNSIIGRAIQFVWMFTIPLVIGFIFVSDVLVPVYLGEEFERSIILMQIFSPIVLFVGMANIIGLAFLMPIGKQNVYLFSVIIAAIVNLCLNLILIPKLFSVGAAIASVIAEFISITIQIAYVLKKKMLDARTIFLCSWKYLIAGPIMGGVLIVVKMFVPIAVWSLITLIATGIAVYFTVLLIMRDRIVLEAIKSVVNKFGKKRARIKNADKKEE